MDIMDQQLAQAMLAEVEQTQQRSGRFLGYWRQGRIIQIWGLVWMAAHLATFFLPARSGSIWLVCDAVGFAATIWLRLRSRDAASSKHTDRRLLCAALILLLFGMLASLLIGPHGRAIEVLWTCMAMTGYMLYGLWAGLRWTVLGAAVMAASLAAYFCLGPWYDLAMAAAAGGGLLLGGTWIRNAR
ncbi:hypothetical protein [Pseudoduganella aquatica]|uniref:Uncharacterized protein n=1 Tax=Pseudoduganella aquatica TaxID=2660641 RepID=A0A7X4HIX7_9BURK|nr:hypothetical protein [Pseudoduganella aquatica]MYN11327.1 hypothetical protein [Pseudoduganella aquatica]